MGEMQRRTVLRAGAVIGAASATLGAGVIAKSVRDSRAADTTTPGRIDPLGHELTSQSPAYTYGHVNEAGTWGVIGSFPQNEASTASTLYNLEQLDDPREVHRLALPDEHTRTNHVRFDGTRAGLYYRTLETDIAADEPGLQGIEVVDFGWDEGTPDDPEIIAAVETPNTGVHTCGEHPDEPIVYLVDKAPTEPGVLPLDVSDPHDPELGAPAGPDGFCHAVDVDPDRELLHCAYITGSFVGYAILDISNPFTPTQVGTFSYADQPDYETVGVPGFEYCHQAQFDPEREIVIVGDERPTGVPGGKHVFDIGWGDGSLENPQPIGFVTSPDAREMDQNTRFWWTTHFHDLVRDGEEVLLVDGGYRNGAWVGNLTDPTNPVATERYATDQQADIASESSVDIVPQGPPFAWSAVYNEEREFAFVSDSLTGAYTFDVTAAPARGPDERGPDGHYDLETVRADGD